MELQPDLTREQIFASKVRTLLLRAHRVVRTFYGDRVVDPSFDVLDDLDRFSNVTSLQEIIDKLGGNDSLALDMFLTVADDDEKQLLETYGSSPAFKEEAVKAEPTEKLKDRKQLIAFLEREFMLQMYGLDIGSMVPISKEEQLQWEEEREWKEKESLKVSAEEVAHLMGLRKEKEEEFD
jgi:hypothetical protein